MDYSKEFYGFYRKSFSADTANETNTIIVFDTNSLLNVFRFSPKASEEYFRTIKKIQNWVYIPYLVALEFHFHKKETLLDVENKVKDFENLFAKKWGKIGSEFSKDLFKGFSFRDFKSGNSSDSKKLEQTLSKEIMDILNKDKEQIENKTFDEIKKMNTRQNRTFTELIEIMQEKTGAKYDQEEISDIQKEGTQRYSKKIPPGFGDSGKKDVRIYGGIEYEQKFGDLIIWKDMIKKATATNINNVIFVTSDGKSDKKHDLVYKVNSKIIGARIELIEEMKTQANADIFIMDELEFMRIFSDMEISPVITKSIEKFYSGNADSSSDNFGIVEITDEYDLESVIEHSDELQTELESFLSNHYMDNHFSTDTPHFHEGWGEIDEFQILNVSIDNYELDFDTISGEAVVECNVDYSIVNQNPMYEKGDDSDSEFYGVPDSNDVSVTVEFEYIRSENLLNIEVESLN